MFKKHPVVLLLCLLLSIILLILLKNSVLLFWGCCVFAFIRRNCDSKYYAFFLKVVACLSFINLFWGNLMDLIKIFCLVIYVIEVLKDYNRFDFLCMCDFLFPHFPSFAFSLYQYTYYQELFLKNYHQLMDMAKSLGYQRKISYYFYVIKRCHYETKKDLEDIKETYARRLYFSKMRNRYKICVEKEDIFFLILHVAMIILVCYVGRSSYAIFH